MAKVYQYPAAAAAAAASPVRVIISSLPYTDRESVIRAVDVVIKQIPSLKAKSMPFMGPDRIQRVLLNLVGTVPVSFQGGTYHIPVSIWIPQTYPNVPPTLYVTPTSDMYIKPRHRHVDIHGQVFLPYLHSWNPRTSSLQEAIATTISVFEQDSPVFSKPAPQPAVAQAIPMGYGGAGAMAGAGRGAGYGMAQPVQPQPQPYQPQPQYQPQPAAIPHSYPLDQKHAQPQSQYQPQAQYQPAQYQARPIVAAQLEAESKAAQLRETKNAVAQLLQQKCAVLYQRTGEEIGSLMEQQEILKKRSEQTGLHAQALQQEKAQLAASIKQMETKSKEIETWLQQHDTEAKLNPDEVVIYKDSWSQQIFECVARDNAIEDTLEVLDRALRDDRIELTAFLKQVRKLARKQFFARALAIKIGKEQAGIR